MNIGHLLIDSRTNGHKVYVDNWEGLNIPNVIHYKFYGIDYPRNNCTKFNFYIKYLKSIFILLFEFRNKFSNCNYLILHGTRNYIYFLPFLFSTKKFRFLIIHEEIKDYNNIYYFLKFYNFFSSNKILFISVKKTFNTEEQFIYLPPTISPLIRNFEILCDDSKNELDIKFISIGNVNFLKGYDLVLENFPFKNLNGSYLIYGGLYNTQLNYINKVNKLIKSLNSNSFQIKLMGQLSLDNVPDVLLDMNFLLLPSRSEASPIVVLEALALGKIVIASNVGDLHYWVNVFDGLFITDFKENFLFHTYSNINSTILERAKKNKEHPILKGDYFYNFCAELSEKNK